MEIIEKSYFTLDEIEERWRMPHRDLVYLAENGLLKVSIRLYGVRLEQGYYLEADKNQWCSVPEDQSVFQGLQDLRPQDVYRLYHEGAIRAETFDAPEERYCVVLQPEEGVLIRKDELVVRRAERDRVEAQHGLVRAESPRLPALQVFNDYREVRFCGLTFKFGVLQARVVKLLHQASLRGEPWRNGKALLGEAGSGSRRMGELFKSQPEWQSLIESDRRGRYRIKTTHS